MKTWIIMWKTFDTHIKKRKKNVKLKFINDIVKF